MYTSSQRLLRSRNEKIIAGVAGGIATYLDVDPVFVRLTFVALAFVGVGVLLYPLLWLVMPLEAETTQQATYVHLPDQPHFDPMTGQRLDEADIPINNVAAGPADPSARERRNRLLGYALLIVGGLFLLSTVAGASALLAKMLFPAILIGAGVYLLRRPF